MKVEANKILPRRSGSDTTATSLASIFFYLSHYPDTYAKARDEVRRAFSSADEISLGAKLNSCTYLRMCIDESMRITPPIGASLFREAGPGGVTVDGHHFPAGIDVGTSIYSIHHNADYFPRPHRFMPERWAAGAEHVPGGASAALNPFSLGPRGCIGKSLAIVEIMLTMAAVIWHYDFKLVDGPGARAGEGKSDDVWGRRNPDEFQLYHGGITSVKDGPVLQFACRG
jgi:cytochrome P450